MDGSETPLQKTTRHVRKGEAKIERQRALIAKMEKDCFATVGHEKQHVIFENIQALQLAHLKRLQN